MASNLDRSLDEIITSTTRPARRGRGGKSTAPTAGVTKRSARVQQQQKAAAPAKAASSKAPAKAGNATKMIVSNLPYDISDGMIKEYFGKMVGNVKRATVTYGPNGVSRGIATVEFLKAGDANTAFNKYNGTTVDKRPMKIELVVDLTKPAELADRIGAPKGKAAKAAPISAKAKPVTAANTTKGTANNTRGTGRRGGRGARRDGAVGAAPKKTTKTSAELDAEMADYFTAPAGEGNENAAPAQNQGPTVDDDEAL